MMSLRNPLRSDPKFEGDWDFTAAIDLIRSAEYCPTTPKKENQSQNLQPGSFSSDQIPRHDNSIEDTSSGLGDFKSLFTALGLPSESPLNFSNVLSAVLTATEPSPQSTAENFTGSKKRGKRKLKADESKKLSRLVDKVCAPVTPTPKSKAKAIAKDYEKSKPTTSGQPPDTRHEFGELIVSGKNRLAYSEGETTKKNEESRTRQDVIRSILGTPTKTQTRSGGQSQQYNTLLTPASLAPSKHIRAKSEEHVFILYALSSEKLISLVEILLKGFPEDAATLKNLRPLNPPFVPDSEGIHVFVDFSNILIGFHDTLKAHKGISKDTRIPRERLSFSNFAIILERGRSVAKRVLVGSDRLESTHEAEAIGYHTHILERVTKYKELTARQRYFQASQPSQGMSSGSDETPTSRLRRVEQGVDEILHLKMSQSLLDTNTPSTMVLATGDAAEAEYSDGFLRMVERALTRDWKVEIVAFKGNLSRAYTNPDWAAQWGDRFRVIELDSCAELIRLDH